jgi:6-pyruvoyltetrahydropterin/6-carboxytetrahydropterin synthase
MVTLTRAVRLCINDAPPGAEAPAPRPHNTYAGAPAMRGLGRYYELVVSCTGHLDPDTGYFLNIKAIDDAARAEALPAIARACREAPWSHPGPVLTGLLPGLAARLRGDSAGRVRRVEAEWRLTPFYAVAASIDLKEDGSMPAHPGSVRITQHFDFAASHRLHNPRLSDEDNRALFGKCNNPSGHGHNYRVAPTVVVPAELTAGASPFTLDDLERLTDEAVIQRFDHKHLNIDEPELFDPARGGSMPSVENIAKVCYALLKPRIEAVPRGGAPGGVGVKLASVTVWETSKTSCTYPAD